MSRYLLEAQYTPEGTRGLLKEGGSKRRAAIEEAAKSIGAKVDAFYFVLGDTDVVLIVDIPDNTSATALSLVTNASGAVRVRTSVLLTAEEMDKATKKVPLYRAPGQ